MQGRGREKGGKKLSKKEKEQLEKEKAEEEKRKQEEKERKREEKLLGIKPTKQEQKQKKLTIEEREELEKQNESKENQENDEKDLNSKNKNKNSKSKTSQKKSKEQKQQKKIEKKKRQEEENFELNEEELAKLENENDTNEINNENNTDEKETNEMKEQKVIEEENEEKKTTTNSSEDNAEDDDEFSSKKDRKSKKQKTEYVFDNRVDKITMKDLPKDLRKKGILNHDEKLVLLFEYFNQWTDTVQYDEIQSTNKYPFNQLSNADIKDLVQIIDKIGLSNRKKFIKSKKNLFDNENSVSVGMLCFIEAMCLTTDYFDISSSPIDIHLIHFLIQNDCYKAYTLFLLNNSNLNELDFNQHKDICEHLLTTLKKNKNPQSVSLKAFQKSLTIQIPENELKEYYIELTNKSLLLNNKVSNKIFEFGVKQSAQLAYEMIQIDDHCYRHLDEIVLNNVEKTVELLKLVRSKEDTNKMNESHELKLVCSRILSTLKEKNLIENQEYVPLVKICVAILENQMKMQTKLMIMGGVIVGVVALLLFFILNSRNSN